MINICFLITLFLNLNNKGENMKIFTLLTSLLLFLISASCVMANTKQQAAQKKLQSYGCKLIQDAQGKSFYKCKPDAPKSLIKYYSQIVQK